MNGKKMDRALVYVLDQDPLELKMGKAIWYYDINCLSFIMLFESTNCRLIKIDHIIWDNMNQNNNSGIIRENKNIKDINNNRIIIN